MNESSFTIGPDVNLYTACSYDKARTVLLYIDKINFSPPNVNSAYYNIVEQALNNCGWNCRACTDAMCAFAYIYNELLPDNFSDKNKLNTAFLRFALQLDEGQIEGILNAFNDVAASFYYLNSINADKDELIHFFKLLIDELLLDSNYFNVLFTDAVVGSSDVFDDEHLMCDAFFDFSYPNANQTYLSENVKNLKVGFNDNVVKDTFIVANVFMVLAVNTLGVPPSNCSSAKQIATAAFNNGYFMTKNLNPFPPDGDKLHFAFLANMVKGYLTAIKGCNPDQSTSSYNLYWVGNTSISPDIQYYNTTSTYFNSTTFGVCP